MAGTRSELRTGFMAAQSGLQNSLQSLQADLNDVTGKSQTDVAILRAEVTHATATVTELLGCRFSAFLSSNN